MDNHPIPKSDWDGQLPPYIAKNEEIWWQLFPRINPILPPKIFSLFGMAKESPSRDTIGKVVMIADMKANLSHGKGAVGMARATLLNDWGCFCTLREDRQAMRYEYMAGKVGPNLPPNLVFNVPWGFFSMIGLRFACQVNSMNLNEMQRQKYDNEFRKTGIEAGHPIDKSSECAVNITKYQPGYLGKGLNTAFNAALWLKSNQEEALANIWKIRN